MRNPDYGANPEGRINRHLWFTAGEQDVGASLRCRGPGSTALRIEQQMTTSHLYGGNE